MRKRALVAITAGLSALVGVATVAAIRDERPQATPIPTRTSPVPAHTSPLPAGNLRILTAAQTSRLVRYASKLATCLSRGGVPTAAPRIDRRTIALETARPVGLAALVSATTACADRLGDPPAPSSLQAVDADTIALSLPKQCLLDPSVEARPQPA